MICVNNVSFAYEKGKMVINRAHLEFQRAGCTAIIGPNGGGKTTLGKLMAGILKPTTGHVLVDGLDTSKVTLSTIGERIGYLFQEPDRQIFAPSVREELAFALELKGVDPMIIEEKVKVALKQFDLLDLEDASPFQLSRGEKQRLAIAAIMVNTPCFFVLDEPTTGLDYERKGILSAVINQLLERGIGMVVISHDMAFVRKHAIRVISIEGGEVHYDGLKLP